MTKKKRIARLRSTETENVSDTTKKFETEYRKDQTDENIPGKSNIQRKRSFTRSTDKSFVGSIRDRFRSNKPKPNENKSESFTDKKNDSRNVDNHLNSSTRPRISKS